MPTFEAAMLSFLARLLHLRPVYRWRPELQMTDPRVATALRTYTW